MTIPVYSKAGTTQLVSATAKPAGGDLVRRARFELNALGTDRWSQCGARAGLGSTPAAAMAGWIPEQSTVQLDPVEPVTPGAYPAQWMRGGRIVRFNLAEAFAEWGLEVPPKTRIRFTVSHRELDDGKWSLLIHLDPSTIQMTRPRRRRGSSAKTVKKNKEQPTN